MFPNAINTMQGPSLSPFLLFLMLTSVLGNIQFLRNDIEKADDQNDRKSDGNANIKRKLVRIKKRYLQVKNQGSKLANVSVNSKNLIAKDTLSRRAQISTKFPSSSPQPTTTPIVCENDETFSETCEWISKNTERSEKHCPYQFFSDKCPIICKADLCAFQEIDVLKKIYENNGNQWTRRDGWLIDDNYCNWYGVTCNKDFKVNGLKLPRNGMKGTIPTEIGGLTELRKLHLYVNNLTGTIPTELGNLTKLQSLQLNRNPLTGKYEIE